MPPVCPWDGLRSLAAPNVKWCEAQLCGWIVEPANTWSNVAYLVLGAALLLTQRGRLARTFGWAQVAVGSASFVYHASWTFALQVLDFLGMYLFLALPLTLNLVRLEVVTAARFRRVYGALVVGLTVVTVPLGLLRLPIQAIVGLLILLVLGSEGVLSRRDAADRRWFRVCVALLFAGATLSALDATRVLCVPDDHLLQGHAAWHVLTALSLLAAWKFYSQFEPAPAVPDLSAC